MTVAAIKSEECRWAEVSALAIDIRDRSGNKHGERDRASKARKSCAFHDVGREDVSDGIHG
jgi:hypothetical protein